MNWIVAAVLVSLARVAVAQPGATPAGPCSQLEAYRSSLALHRSWKAKACIDDGDDDCKDQSAAVDQLAALLARCQAGEDLGPPPTTFTRATPPQGASSSPRIIARFEGLVGGALALGDTSWKQSIGASPTLAARFGVARGPLAALVSAEWTLEQLSAQPTIVPFPSNEQSMRRIRLLAHVAYEIRPIPALAVGGRAGIGVDYATAHYSASPGGAPVSEDVSGTGLAFELGATAWWQVGEAVELGGGLALPIANQSTTEGAVRLTYTSYDLQLLLGVRVSSHH